MTSKNSRRLLAVLSLLLAIGPATLFAGAGKASAQAMRVAIVESMKGTVSVMKSGGAKSFHAFKNMSLNEGDQIATGKGASVVLQLASEDADKDTITIGESSQVTFTKLKDSGGTKTKMSVWAGSLWVKVKSVSNASDQFEVETPTSIMGVRGTQFFVGVDPRTGMTNVFLAAGVIEAITSGIRLKEDGVTKQDNSVVLYPTQQLNEANREDGEGLTTSISVIDIANFINEASSDMIKAILEDAKSIREEQERMLKQAEESMGDPASKENFGGAIQNEEDLANAADNFTNMLSIMAREAIEQKKIDQGTIDQINDDADERLIDSNTKAALTLTEEEKAKQDAAKKLADQQKKLGELKDKQNQALLDQMNQAVAKAKEQQKKIAKENQAALQALTEKLEKLYFEKLTAEEQAKFNQNRGQIEMQPIDLGSGTATGSTGGSTASGFAALKFSQTVYETSPLIITGSAGAIDINVVFSGFIDSRAIKGYQIEIEYDNLTTAFDESRFDGASTALNYRAGGGGFVVEPEGQTVKGANSVDDFRIVEGDSKNTLVYTVAKFAGSSAQMGGETTVVKLPFIVTAIMPINQENGPEPLAQPAKFRIKSITAVDAAGEPVAVVKGSERTLQIKSSR